MHLYGKTNILKQPCSKNSHKQYIHPGRIIQMRKGHTQKDRVYLFYETFFHNIFLPPQLTRLGSLLNE